MVNPRVGCVLGGLGLVLGGCDAGAPKIDCDGAVNAVLRAARAPTDDQTAKVKHALLARCRQDRWTPEAAACMRSATSATTMLDCRHQHLTGAQDEALASVLELVGGDASGEFALGKFAEFRDQMCACKDSECAKRVSDDMTRWSQEQVSKQKEPPKMTEAQTRRATEIGTHMGDCMQKAMGMGSAPTSDESQQGGLKESLDREAISSGIAAVKAEIVACGDRSPAKGKVKVKVRVSPEGKVTLVSVETAPDPALGACVAATVQKATFERTVSGGSFSYPFIF